MRRGSIAVAALAGACGLFPDPGGLDGTDASLADVTSPDAPPVDAPAETSVDAGCPTVARVQTAFSTASSAASSVSVPITLGHGHLLVAVLGAQFAGTLTLSDSANNTWSVLTEVANTSCLADAAPWSTRAQLAYTTVAADVTNDLVTLATSSPGDYLTLTLAEYASSGTLALKQSLQNEADGSSNTVAVGPLSATGCANVVVAMLADEYPSGDTWTPFAGFQVLSKNGDWSYVAVDDPDAGPGALVAGASHTPSDHCWAAAAAAFAPQ